MAKIKDGRTYLGQHLSANDYYSKGEQVIGQWVGRGAERFGLAGKSISPGDTAFENLRINRLPDGAGKLTERDSDRRIRFFDFQCSAQKSVSIMAVTLGDQRLLEAHDMAVAKALGELEKFVACQCNTRTERANRITGNLIGAVFRHTASRQLDCQVHTHNVVANATWDETSQKWKALNEVKMLEAIRYAGKVYQSGMARECLDLGYEIEYERNGKGIIVGFEIKGVEKAIRDRFSKRRQVIEKEMAVFREKQGRNPTAQEIHAITTRTRDPKLAEISTPKVIAEQRAQLSASELASLEEIKAEALRKSGEILDSGLGRERESLRMAIAHIYERRSVVCGHELAAEALNLNLGHVDIVKLLPMLQDRQLVSLTDGHQPLDLLYATRAGLKLEKRCVEMINAGQNRFPALDQKIMALADKLSLEQRQALRQMTVSTDQFLSFRGVAGSGKTTTLKELDRILRANGKEVYYGAPTASAAATLRKEGLANATTVSDLLLNGPCIKGAVFVVDEAGLASNKLGEQLLGLAVRQEARIIFVGDTRQHVSVDAGDFLRVMERHSRLEKIVLQDIRRQRVQEYREAVHQMAAGRAKEGLNQLDRLGWIREDGAGYINAAAADYLQATDKGKQLEAAICVAPTWAENHALTDQIRNGLKTNGLLGQGEPINVHESLKWTVAQKSDSRNYAPGMWITFQRSSGSFKRGQFAEVLELRGNQVLLQGAGGRKQPLAANPEDFDVAAQRAIEISVNDRLLIRSNDKKNGLVNGQLLTVAQIEGGVIRTTTGQVVDTNRFKSLAHGYVLTSHASQGKTAERVIIAAARWDAKAAYVACSRGRESCSVHTPDKSMLMGQLPEGDRPAALDVLGKTSGKERMLDRSSGWRALSAPYPYFAELMKRAIGTAWFWSERGLNQLIELTRSLGDRSAASPVSKTTPEIKI